MTSEGGGRSAERDSGVGIVPGTRIGHALRVGTTRGPGEGHAVAIPLFGGKWRWAVAVQDAGAFAEREAQRERNDECQMSNDE